MALLQDEMRRTYAAQRGVSQGAAVTLTAVSGGYQARFECAERCKAVLGDRHLSGSKLDIPTEETLNALSKLSEKFSVALVDTVTDNQGTRFVLVWKVMPRSSAPAVQNAETEVLLTTIFTDEDQGKKPTYNLDEF